MKEVIQELIFVYQLKLSQSNSLIDPISRLIKDNYLIAPKPITHLNKILLKHCIKTILLILLLQ